MGDLLIQKTVPAEECERFANALTGREYRCGPSKLYTISVRAHGAAQQHQGDPVALPERKGTHLRYDTMMPTFSKGWNACLDEIAKLGPLYPNADPGEVGRLRAELGAANAAMYGECEKLRALLDRVVDHANFWHDHPYAEVVEAIARDYKALSASAEPSAPKCETCNGTGMVDDGEITCSEGGTPYENGPVKCVKDCPVCKPSAPVTTFEDCRVSKPNDGFSTAAPVERDERAMFEKAWAETVNVEVYDLHRKQYPLTSDADQPYDTPQTQLAWMMWQARAGLSASAPVEHDERAKFESAYPGLVGRVRWDEVKQEYRSGSKGLGWQEGLKATEWLAVWQARAALERKP